MSKKRICHVTTVHTYNDNRIFYKECVSLSQSGFNVTLMACNAINDYGTNVQLVSLKKKRIVLRISYMHQYFRQ